MNPEKLTSNSLVALGSAAVIGVYAAGYFKTKAAADRFAAEADIRRPAPPRAAAASAERTIERVTAPSGDAATRLRTGARAAVPPMPALARAADKPSAGVAPRNAAAGQASVANAIESSVPADPVPAPSATQSPAPATAKQAESESASAPKSVRWKDGTYFGWGTSRHGDIQAAVVIQDGRIMNAAITQCLTRYSCSWIAALPPQVVGRQSAEVDYVSGATQSVNAFYYAILEALAQAK